MGGKSEQGDAIRWPPQNTKAFIDIIYDRVKKKELQFSTFKLTIWKEINDELAQVIGENYGIEGLKGKFNRLRTQHREFSTLLGRIGVTWDIESNQVNANEDIWQDLIPKGRFYRQFKKNGFEHNYKILGEIFNTSTATGVLSNASSQEPPPSDEETELEDYFLSKGVHIVDIEDENVIKGWKKNKAIDLHDEHRHKSPKIPRLDKLEACLDQWVETITARKEAYMAKAEQHKVRANEPVNQVDPYSIDVCMELLDSMEDVSDSLYNKSLKLFKDPDWRQIFIKMPAIRRKG